MYPTAYYTYNPGRYRRAEKAFYNKMPLQHHYPGTVIISDKAKQTTTISHKEKVTSTIKIQVKKHKNYKSEKPLTQQ